MSIQSVKQKNSGPQRNHGRKLLSTTIWDAVFPPRCAGCRTWNEHIFCASCQNDLQPITTPWCFCCGKPFDKSAQVLPQSLCADCRDNRYHAAPSLTARRAPLEYSGPIREAIHALKYRGKTALAKPLAELLWEYCANVPQTLETVDLIVPVPLHPFRRWRRGYNQSMLLAQELSRLAQRPMAEVLMRTRHTQPQIELGTAQRAANVSGAFALDERTWPTYSAIQSALLLDDVATTGSTLNECARVLKKAGVPTVYALTIARRD